MFMLMLYFQLIETPWYLNCLKRIKIIVENNANLLIVIFDFSLAAPEPGLADVEIESQGRIPLGFTRMFYYPNKRQTRKMVHFEEPDTFRRLCEDMSEDFRGANSSSTGRPQTSATFGKFHFKTQWWSLQSGWLHRCGLLTNGTIFCFQLLLFPSQWDSFTKTLHPIRFQGFFK